MAKRPSILEMRIYNIINHHRFPDPVREYTFHPTRKWRFDFAWPDRKLALEAEGGVFINGGHSRGAAYTKDTEKYNQAIVLGWKVLRYTVKNVYDIPKDLDSLLNKGGAPIINIEEEHVTRQ